MKAGQTVTDLIQKIREKIDQAETSKNSYDFIEARRLLVRELPQAIDDYVKEEKEVECV